MTAGEFRDHLTEWGLSRDELNEIIAENPPVFSTLSGFVSEYKLRKLWLQRPEFTGLARPRSHDRKAKGDFTFAYKGRRFVIEVKSLDTPKIKRDGDGWCGTFQCNASDSRPIPLPCGGPPLKTNCLAVGGFDVLAVGLFGFGQEWRFGFAKNSDLPRSTFPKYTEDQRRYLLKSAMPICWPLKPPYSADLLAVLDSILRQ